MAQESQSTNRLFPNILTDFIEATGWSYDRPQPGKLHVTSDGLARCSGIQRKYCLSLHDGDGITFHLTDGRYRIEAHADETTHFAGDLDLATENCEFEIIDFDLFIGQKLTADASKTGTVFYVFLKRVVNRYSNPLVHGKNLRDVAEEINIKTLAHQVARYVDSLQELRGEGVSLPPDHIVSTRLEPSPAARVALNLLDLTSDYQRLIASAPASDAIMAPAETASDTHAENVQGRSEAEQAFRESIRLYAESTETQRWADFATKGFIPRYGSTPTNTSKEQVKLLSDEKSWDPPAVGSRLPLGYIPPKDFEQQVQFTDAPRTVSVQDLARSVDEPASKERRESPGQSHEQGSTQEELVTYALQRRASRPGTPDGTAVGPSQWEESPAQRRPKETSTPATPHEPQPSISRQHAEAQGSPGASESENEDDEDDAAEDRPPPDTEDELSPHKSTLYHTSELINKPHNDLANVQRELETPLESLHVNLTPSQETPQQSGHAGNSILLDEQRTALPTAQSSQVAAPVTSAVHPDSQTDRFETLVPQPPVAISSSYPTMSAQTLDVKAGDHAHVETDDSDIEFDIPRGINDKPSNFAKSDSAIPTSSPEVQVGRTPMPAVKSVPTANLSRNPMRAANNFVKPLHAQHDQSRAPKRNYQAVQTEDSLGSRKIPKLLEVADSSPRFSQGLRALEGSNSTLSQFRREYFNKDATHTEPARSTEAGTMARHARKGSLKPTKQDQARKTTATGINSTPSHEIRNRVASTPAAPLSSVFQEPTQESQQQHMVGLVGGRSKAVSVSNLSSEHSSDSGRGARIPVRAQARDLSGSLVSPPPPPAGNHTPLNEKRSRGMTRSSPPQNNLFGKFKAAYPMYSDDEGRFATLCARVVESKPGFLLYRAFCDDFVIRYSTEYGSYYAQCFEKLDVAVDYETWFADNVEAVSFNKRILSKEAAAAYLSSRVAKISSRHEHAANDLESSRSDDRQVTSRPRADNSSPVTDPKQPHRHEHNGRIASSPMLLPGSEPVDLTRDKSVSEIRSMPQPKKARRSLPWAPPTPAPREQSSQSSPAPSSRLLPIHPRAATIRRQSAATPYSSRKPPILVSIDDEEDEVDDSSDSNSELSSPAGPSGLRLRDTNVRRGTNLAPRQQQAAVSRRKSHDGRQPRSPQRRKPVVSAKGKAYRAAITE